MELSAAKTLFDKAMELGDQNQMQEALATYDEVVAPIRKRAKRRLCPTWLRLLSSIKGSHLTG